MAARSRGRTYRASEGNLFDAVGSIGTNKQVPQRVEEQRLTPCFSSSPFRCRGPGHSSLYAWSPFNAIRARAAGEATARSTDGPLWALPRVQPRDGVALPWWVCVWSRQAHSPRHSPLMHASRVEALVGCAHHDAASPCAAVAVCHLVRITSR